MKTTRHPWLIEANLNQDSPIMPFAIVTKAPPGEGRAIAWVMRGLDGEALHNAHLMAAAPELYIELQALIYALTGPMSELPRHIASANKALAKARLNTLHMEYR